MRLAAARVGPPARASCSSSHWRRRGCGRGRGRRAGCRWAARGFADDVPQRLLEAGQGAVEFQRAAPLGVVVEQHRRGVLDLERVAPRQIARELAEVGGHGRVAVVLRIGLAPAGDAGVGAHPHEDQVLAPARVEQKTGDFGDLHRQRFSSAGLNCRPSVRRTGTKAWQQAARRRWKSMTTSLPAPRRAVLAGLATALAAPLVASQARADDAAEIRVAFGNGIAYLPFYVGRKQDLFAKALAEAGFPNVKVAWPHLAGTSALNDAMLSGSGRSLCRRHAGGAEVWDRTEGAVQRHPRLRRGDDTTALAGDGDRPAEIAG